jgi:hypothetical protein
MNKGMRHFAAQNKGNATRSQKQETSNAKLRRSEPSPSPWSV